MTKEKVYGALFGVAIGDALGVPAEFVSRDTLRMSPVTDYEGYKSHNQPPGTFSDDSSLTFCLAASLCNGYDLQDIGQRFQDWLFKGYWTAGGNVFDVGMTTSRAIGRLRNGVRPDLAGDFEEDANGNGSLMRILPLLFYVKGLDVEKRFEIVKEVSSITHGHIRSVAACFYYIEFALCLLAGKDKFAAYQATAAIVATMMKQQGIVDKEIELFAPLLTADIRQVSIDSLPSSGYVLHTLKASMYCLLTTNSYKEAVLMAVNLGNDSDTTAAVTGGLAGLYYGYDSIPREWRTGLRKAGAVTDLCEHMLVAFP